MPFSFGGSSSGDPESVPHCFKLTAFKHDKTLLLLIKSLLNNCVKLLVRDI